MIIWERVLKVVFTSKTLKKQIVFGDNTDSTNLQIEVRGNKFLSTLKDEFVVSIFNLSYGEVAKLISHKYDEIDVYAGYRSTSVKRIFSGKVFYISNERESRESNVVHFICISKLLGIHQSKVNLTLNSGINMYSALDFVIKRGGIKDSNISEEFKRQFLTDVMNAKGGTASILDSFMNDSDSYVVQADSSEGSTLSIWDMRKTDSRIVPIKLESGMIVNGFPTLTTDGVRFDSLPVFNYMPGDTLLIDNKIIDMSISSLSEAQRSNLGMFLDKNGQYLLYKIEYYLSNTDGDFKLTLKAKSKTMLTNVMGVK